MVQNTSLVSKMQADQWYRQLLRSHEMMQQVVGGADPASPLEVDWDTASATSTDQPEDERGSGMLCRQTKNCSRTGCFCLPNVHDISHALAVHVL